jgi:hypothetical protein
MAIAVTAQQVNAAGTNRTSMRSVTAAGPEFTLDAHPPHTVTRLRSFSKRAGPMPSTSPNWSTLVNFPLASRHATIAAAVTGPMPGSVSSCSTLAVLRSIGPAAGPLGEPDAGGAVGWPEEGVTPLPSSTG